LRHSDLAPCVALAADEEFALPLAVAVRSLSEHLEDTKLCAYIIDGGLTKATRSKLRSSWPKTVEARFMDVDPKRLEALPLSKDLRVAHVTRSTYIRLLAPDLVPQMHRKILFLDADILALDDVRELWRTNLGNYPVAAVQDGGIRFVGSPSGLLNYEELGLRPNAKYFNAGVLLMNLDIWRAEDLSKQILDYIASNRSKIRFNDQDALNAVLHDRWKQLDASWNVLVFGGKIVGERQLAPNDQGTIASPPGAKILHFITPQKPWKRGFLHQGYRKLYLGYQRRTAWATHELR
jgi:lipopolysaccharide biosynthesis glycosyltransferase